jgi:3-deoxy-manno-octulosonate cytidylyltransferase (CMP-KDO synthetase)
MVTTLARKINQAESQNDDRVKVVFDKKGKALYFSRAPIPYHRDGDEKQFYRHIGLYGFRMNVLEQFVHIGPGRLEKTEKLEQLRLLENGIPIHIVITEHESIGVDRPEDLKLIEKMLSR